MRGAISRFGILPQPIVEHHDAQRIQQLPLVFVDALDLAIEDAVRVYRFAGRPLEPIGKLRLGLAFGLEKGVTKRLVVGQWFELFQLAEVGHPAVADSLGDRVARAPGSPAAASGAA